MTGNNVRDTALKQTKALPNGAAATVIDGFDLGLTSRADFRADVELLLTAPALATGVMGDGKTMIYTVETDSDSAYGSPTVVGTILTQTGAGGAGAAAATSRFKFPTNIERYVRVKATGSTTGNCSSSSMTVEILA